MKPSASIALLRQLEWRVRHAVENVLSGEYRSTFRGRGMEFDQVVKYEFGDDVRDIDWNVTARLGEPYRKKFVEEREITIFLVFEDSPSLRFGSGSVTKRDALLELAGLLMLLSATNRDRIGCLHVMASGSKLYEPVRGRGPIMHVAAQLLGSPPPRLTSGQQELFHQSAENIPWSLVTHSIPRHSVLVWLGDFAPRPVPRAWIPVSKRYQTMGFRIDDPWERELPDESLTVYDPLSQRLITLDHSHAQLDAHAAWNKERETAWEQLFPRKLDRLALTTEESRLDALVRFFQARTHARSR